MPLPISRKAMEAVQKVHGRWRPKVELLTGSAREHIRDYKEGQQEGAVSPANALEFSVDGSVRLAATSQQDVAYAAGTALFDKPFDDLTQTTDGNRALVFELDAARGDLEVTRATLRLHRKPNAAQPAFDGSFILYVGYHGIVSARKSFIPITSVEVKVSNVAWTADEAEVAFSPVDPVRMRAPSVIGGTSPRPTLRHLVFVLTVAGGSNSNAAWMHDTAQTDGEETTLNKGTLSWWRMEHIPVLERDRGIVVTGPRKVSQGGYYRFTKAASLGRAAIFARTTTGASATLTFRPNIIVARKSVNQVGSPPATARLQGLGYSVTENLTATVADCRAFDVVVIAANAWGADEHNAFIQSLLADGQKVIVEGNDSGTGLFYISATHATSAHTPNQVGAAQKLVEHLVWEAVTTLPNDADTGIHIVTLASGAVGLGKFDNDAAAFSVVEYDDPATAGLLLHMPRLELSGNDSDRFLRNAVAYLGAKDFGLGAVPTGDVEFVGQGETPASTALLFEVWNGSAWVTYADGDRAAIELSGVAKHSYQDIRITFTGSGDSLRTPVLRSAGIRDLKTRDISKLVEFPDFFFAVTDIPRCKTEVAELRLRGVRVGNDPFDPIAQLVADTANITAAHVRLSITGPGLGRKDDFHVETMRVDDYEPGEHGIELICLSALDRLKLPIPKRKLVSGTWVVEPARYDGAGHTITSTFTDVRDGQLGLAQRYRGSVPQSGPTDPGGVVRSAVQGQVGGAGVGAAGKTELAKDVLEELAYLAGGALVTERGKIHYRDLYGPKTAVAFFPDRELKWGGTSPGLRARSPRFLVSFQPNTLGGTDWTKSIERDDAAIVAAIEQAGAEAGLELDKLDDKIGRWIRVPSPTALEDGTTDDAEGLADAIAHRQVRAFGAGQLMFRFTSRIPRPEIRIGEQVAAETRRFVARDPILNRRIIGTAWVRGVVVGRNAWGTDFLIWPRGYTDIFPAQTKVVTKGAFPLVVELTVEEIVGQPQNALVRARALVEGADVTIRYAILADGAAVPAQSVDPAVWTTYAGPVTVARDASAKKKVAAWADYRGAWGSVMVVEISADRRPQVLGIAIDATDAGAVTATLQADADTGSIKFVGRKTGFPSLADVQARPATDGRNVSGTVVDAATGAAMVLNAGEFAYVAAVAYSRAAAAGAEGPLAQARTAKAFLPSNAIISARAIWRANRLFLNGNGNTGVGSMKFATSTVAYPAAGTGTAVNTDADQDATFDAGTFTYGATVYVTITPYSSAGGTGTQGPAFRMRARLFYSDVLFREADGVVKRTAPYDDAGFALVASATDGLTAAAGVKDSAARLVNVMFSKTVDDTDDVVEGVITSFVAPAYVDTSNRPTALRRVAGVHDMSADLLGEAIALDPLNLVRNGGGQEGALGSQAAGWTFGAGNALVPAIDASKFGDRSLKHDNPTATDSFSSQDLSVKIGRLYRLSGWIKTTALPVADTGAGAYLNVDIVTGVTGFTVLEKRGVGADQNSVQPDVGIAADGTAYDWTFVFSRFKPTGADGTIRLYVQLGYGGGQSGTAWFDGVRIEEEPVEHITRVDEVLDTSGTNRLRAAALDSRALAVNSMFGKTADDTDDVLQGVTRKLVAGVNASDKATSSSIAPNLGLGFFDNGLQSAGFTLNWNNGNHQRVELGASALALTLSNPQEGARYLVYYQQDSTGGRTLPVHPGNVSWANDAAPTLSTGAGQIDAIEYHYLGGVYHGRVHAAAMQQPPPNVLSVTTSAFGVDATSHLVAMPATVDPNDLLLMLFVSDGAPGHTTPVDWTLVGSFTGPSGPNITKVSVFAKVAVGTEDGTTVNVVTGTAETAAAQVYRIKADTWWGTISTGVAIAGNVVGTSTAPDPPSLTPSWGARRDLWVAIMFVDLAPAVNAFPASYTNGTTTASGGGAAGCELASARRLLYATAENPGAFTLGATGDWGALTVAVRPVV